MRRRDFLAIGGSTLLGGTIVGTGAVSRNELERSGDIVVAEDSEAYVALSNKKIQPDLLNKFDSRQEDSILDIQNRFNTTIEPGSLDITSKTDIEISRRSLPARITTGSTGSITANITFLSDDPSLTYELAVNNESDNTRIVTATRTRKPSPSNKLQTTDGRTSNERHVLRAFPSNFGGEDIAKLEIPLRDADFDLGDVAPGDINVRVGSTTRTDGSGFLSTSSTVNGEDNILTITFDNTKDLNQINANVILVDYSGVNQETGTSNFENDITITVTGEDDTTEDITLKLNP